jgi:hypothetical protein
VSSNLTASAIEISCSPANTPLLGHFCFLPTNLPLNFKPLRFVALTQPKRKSLALGACFSKAVAVRNHAVEDGLKSGGGIRTSVLTTGGMVSAGIGSLHRAQPDKPPYSSKHVRKKFFAFARFKSVFRVAYPSHAQAFRAL